MKLTEFIRGTVERLGALYPEREARSIVLMLTEAMLGTKNYTHIVEPGYEIRASKEADLAAAVERLAGGEPIQYVLGKAEFYGRTFNVSPAVLIPRPETELLCREAIKIAERMVRMRSAYGKTTLRILDLCTGSGCIAWTMALEIPGAEVVGVDISNEALKVACSQNFPEMEKNGSSIRFAEGDVLNPALFPELGKFDLVLSNPPYIKESEKAKMRPNVLEHEPAIALFVPDEDPQLFYRAVGYLAKRLLNPEGFGLVEINETEGPQTQAAIKAEGFSRTTLVKDINNRNRFVEFA